MSVCSPCRDARFSTCWAILTLVPGCSGNGANALPAVAYPPAAAEVAVLRHACVSVSAAVAVIPRPSAFTVTVPAVTHTMTFKHEILSETSSTPKKEKEKVKRSSMISHLHRALPGSEHRSNCRTHSKAHRCGQSWICDTHTGHNNSPPDHCISLSHWLRGSCSTKQSPHCIRIELRGSPADRRTHHTGRRLGPQCTGCCLLSEAAGSRTNKETPVPHLSCPEGPPPSERSVAVLTGILEVPPTR